MVGDLVRLIGKMCEYQDEFTAAQLKLKILDEVGRAFHRGEGLGEDAGLAERNRGSSSA